MVNETSINRTSTDSSISVHRKKSPPKSIEVDKLSFFNELLNIGRFDSSSPDTIGLPIGQPVTHYREPEIKSISESNDEVGSEVSDLSADSNAGQSSYSVALADQLLPSQSQSLVPDPESEKVVRNQSGTNAMVKSHPKSASENSGSEALPSTANTSESNAQAALDSSADTESAVDADSQETNSELDLKKIEKGRGSASTSDSNSDQNESVESNLELDSTPLQSDSSVESGIAISRPLANQSDNESSTDNNDATTPLPRSKRAERLAQRASDGDQASDDRDPSTTSSEPIDSAPPSALKETPTDASFFSSTSEASSSLPITNISQAIAPPIAINSSVTSTSTTTRSSVEGISAIGTSTTAGGIHSNLISTNLTSGTSTPTSPARTEHGGGEVARSNAGSRISAYQEVKLVQRVLRGVEQLANGGGQVRLRLHPPELGSLQMSLRMEAGQVFAKLEVENSTARDALLNNIQTLRDRLTEQGMRIAAFEVEVSTDSTGSGTGGSNFQGDGGTERQSRWNNATSRFALQNENRLSSEPRQPERKSGAAWTRTNGSLDLTV